MLLQAEVSPLSKPSAKITWVQSLALSKRRMESPCRHVELSVLVLAEAQDVPGEVLPLAEGPAPAADLVGEPDAGRAVVGEDVGAAEPGDAAAVAVAAGDRAVRVRVRVDQNRLHKGAGAAAGAGDVAFPAVPPVILAAGARRGLEGDLFPEALADVRDEQVPGLAIEAPAIGVAQPAPPDLVGGLGIADKGVIGRNVVRRHAHLVVAGVDAQDLAQEVEVVLRRSARGPPVAQPDVQVAVVGAEVDIAAVVVPGRLGESEDLAPARHIGVVRIAGEHREALDDRLQRRAVPRVVDIEVAVVGELGMEGEAQQPALEEGVDVALDVEKRDPKGAVRRTEDLDGACALDDEETAGAVIRVAHGHHRGGRRPGRNELEIGRRLGRSPCRDDEGETDQKDDG